ncbi:transposase [Paenibacillus donghaensis]|uniref:transposase n=1 Tax=Paenibacillus donghaensis TaxID=414771 RepID=UPI0012FCF050
MIFTDDYAHEIRVATNLKHLSAEQIADMYKARWGVEVFFRWIKQNLNVPILFGTTKNAVFNQLFAALMTYLVLKWLYVRSKSQVIACKSIPLIRFKECMQANQWQVEWLIAISKILDRYVYLSRLQIPETR